MKLNENELKHMINQIDDDLLNEAAGEYNTRNPGAWKRVIPVAACIILLISGAAISVLKNGITIETGHDGIEGTAVSGNEGNINEKNAIETDVTDDTELLNSSIEKMDSINTIDEESRNINILPDSIMTYLKEIGCSENIVIDSLSLRIIPKSQTISNGRMVLTDLEDNSVIAISISQHGVVVDETEQEQKEEGDAATETESPEQWFHFPENMKYISAIAENFSDFDYLNISSEYSYGNSSEWKEDWADQYMILINDELKQVTDLAGIEYSYAFSVQVWSDTDSGSVQNNILVLVV